MTGMLLLLLLLRPSWDVKSTACLRVMQISRSVLWEYLPHCWTPVNASKEHSRLRARRKSERKGSLAGNPAHLLHLMLVLSVCWSLVCSLVDKTDRDEDSRPKRQRQQPVPVRIRGDRET